MPVRAVNSRMPNEASVEERDVADLQIAGLGRMVSEISTLGLMANTKSKKPRLKITANELTSLRTLITYVAYLSNDESEKDITNRFVKRFGVTKVESLPAELFDDALRYLVNSIKI